MSKFEHEEAEPNCGCPSCYLADLYVAEYDAYKARKPYLVIDCHPDEIEGRLNRAQAEGYEMTAVHPSGRVIMRSVPPVPITARDVLSELYKRQEEDGIVVADDKIGPTMGGMQ